MTTVSMPNRRREIIAELAELDRLLCTTRQAGQSKNSPVRQQLRQQRQALVVELTKLKAADFVQSKGDDLVTDHAVLRWAGAQAQDRRAPAAAAYPVRGSAVRHQVW